jgi:predicted permease
LRWFFRRRQFERDLAEEVRIHREMAAEKLGPEGARAFGSVALTLEDSRAIWGFGWVPSLAQDIRYAVRGLRKSPGFALVAIGTVGLSLGLNTTLFTVFNSYVLRTFAVRDPHALYGFSWATRKSAFHELTLAEYQDLSRQNTAFSDVVAYAPIFAGIDGRGWVGCLVSGNYFTGLGGGMVLGRPLVDDDGASVVLSYATWKNQYGADTDIVGRTVYLRGHPLEVVGVASAEFGGVAIIPADFWIPLAIYPSVGGSGLAGVDRPPMQLRVVGRLRPGTSRSAAAAALNAWTQRTTANLSAEERATAVVLNPQATAVPFTAEVIAAFAPVFVAFGLVLLISCANVSNMMLARALARRREMGIRVSLGAGRARLVRQMLTESLLLALPAAAAGFLIAGATVQLALRVMFATLPPALGKLLHLPDLAPDVRVFGFILAASTVATLAFGLVPALQTTGCSLVQANRGDFSSDYRPSRLRSVLVVTQVTVCTLLLIYAVVMARGEQWIVKQEINLQTHGVFDLRVLKQYRTKVAERLSAEPAVESVAAASDAPLWNSLRRMAVVPVGSKQAVASGYDYVTPEYFSVFRIPLVSGRFFSAEEAAAEAPVVVLSQATAKLFWPRQEALGQNIALRPAAGTEARRVPAYTTAIVIGIARDTINGWPAQGLDPTCIYFPSNVKSPRVSSLLVRLKGGTKGDMKDNTKGDQGSARRSLEAALNRVAPSVADQVYAMDDVLALQTYPFRVAYWISSLLGGLALVLTITGIYGVMSYLVSQRTKEIGIRVALGAGEWLVVGMVVKQSLRLAATGAAVGVGFALLVSPVFAHEVAAVNPYDVAAYAVGAAVAMAAGFAASVRPARKAAGVDPAVTLRCD